MDNRFIAELQAPLHKLALWGDLSGAVDHMATRVISTLGGLRRGGYTTTHYPLLELVLTGPNGLPQLRDASPRSESSEPSLGQFTQVDKHDKQRNRSWRHSSHDTPT
jgi:hypothetical protein